MRDLLPIIVVVAAAGLLGRVLGPFASAFAKRLTASEPSIAPPDPAIGELREELETMQERLDFLERALVAQKNVSGRGLPGERE